MNGDCNDQDTIVVSEMFKVEWHSYMQNTEDFFPFFYGMGVEVKTETGIVNSCPIEYYSVVLTKTQYTRFNDWQMNKGR